MAQYVNGQDLPISVALWLALDKYKSNPDIISATQLIKPLRQLILKNRMESAPGKVVTTPIEIIGLMKSRKGTAVHESIENAWLDPELRAKGLAALGYTEDGINRFVVNVEPDLVKKGEIPVYVERFCERETPLGYYVGGTADFIVRARLSDFKNTSTYSYIDPTKDKQYQLQGSIYRWAMPDLVQDDDMDIIEMYDDWVKSKSFGKGYPPHPIMVKKIPLLNLKATERYICNKINLIEDHMNSPEPEIPYCTDEELWRRPDVYKYYKNPASTARSSGNFDTYEEAAQKHRADGSVGIIRTVKGVAVACLYCEARPICTQAATLTANGEMAT